MSVNHNREGKYAQYIMQDLILPPEHATPEAMTRYEQKGAKKRVHWIDGNNVPGSFQLNTAWYFKPNRDLLLGPNAETEAFGKWECHVHDVDEMLCFYGSDPENPFDLGGEVEFIMGEETYVLTKSSLIFIPAGIPHSTPLVNRVDRPIFHFSAVLSSEYKMN